MVERDKRGLADRDPAINASMAAGAERLGDELVEAREQLAATSEVVAVIRRSAPDLEGVLAATKGRSVEFPHLRDAPLDSHLIVLAEGGWRSLVAVPMLREGGIVGALVVRRRTPGHVPEEICDLLETFASQSALVLINAQLYRQRQGKAPHLKSRASTSRNSLPVCPTSYVQR